MKRIVLASLLVVSLTGPALANVGSCLGAYRAFAQHKQDLSSVAASCSAAAEKGTKMALSLLGTAYLEAGRHALAEPWLLRAAYRGDITASLLLADVYSKLGRGRMAAMWAYRGWTRLGTLRRAMGGRSAPFLDAVERKARALSTIDLDWFVAEGQRISAKSENTANPFVGKWKVGPNENCSTYYTEITATEAAFYFGSRKSRYDDMRFDIPKGELTLRDGAGTKMFRLVDGNTMHLVTIKDIRSNTKVPGTVIATRCN